MVLLHHATPFHPLRQRRAIEDLRQVDPLRLPVRDRWTALEPVDPAHHLIHRAEADLRHQFAHLLGDVEEEVDDMLGFTREMPAQLRVLGRDSNRAGVQMALAHHDAAHRDERGGREAEFLGAQQRGDHHIATGLQLSVGLHPDAAAQVVEQKHLLCLGEAQLPRDARVLQGAQRRGPGAPGVAADQDHVRMRLGDAGRDRADTDLRDQLDRDARGGVYVLQVEDQLREVLDRVNVVVRRRRNQGHSGRGMPQPCNHLVHLVPRQLAALAGLRALRHLDLQLVGVDQVVRRHSESSRGDLLHRAATEVAVRVALKALLVLPALAGVRLSADAVHGDRQGLVRLLADRAKRHRAGHEPFHDLGRRLNLVERNRCLGELDLEQSAQRAQVLVLLVDQVGVFLERPRVRLPHRVLQLADGVGIQQVILAAQPEVIRAANRKLGLRPRRGPEGVLVLHPRLLREHVQPDAFDPGGRPGKIGLDQSPVQPDGLEDLRAAVALQRRHAHLREGLQQPLVDPLDEILDRLVGGDLDRQTFLVGEALQRLDCQVGIDRASSVADQQREMHHLARLARFDDQGHLRPRPFAHQQIMHGRQSKQTRDRRGLLVHAAVADDQQRVSIPDRQRRALAELLQPAPQPGLAVLRAKKCHQRRRQQVALGDPPKLLQLAIGEHRLRQLQGVAVLRSLFENVSLGTDIADERHHHLFADGVDRRVRHLGEQLLEIVEQQLRTIREAGQRRVGAHRPHRLLTLGGHRREDHLQVLLGVAEGPLPRLQRALLLRMKPPRLAHLLERDLVVLDPLGVGRARRQLLLDLVVGNDPAGDRIHQEHLARLESSLLPHVLRGNVDHARLRRQHHDIVVGHDIPPRTQAVAVQHGADHTSVGEGHRRRTIPRLHQRRMVLVEGVPRRIDMRIARPSLRNQHRHHMREGPPGLKEQLHRAVEGSRVAAALGDDREKLPQVVAEERRLQQRFARLHPVHIAAQRVDLAIVGDVAVRMGQRPAREGVRREALMDDAQRALHRGVGELPVEVRDLRREQQALVDDGPRGKGRNVEKVPVLDLGAGDLMLDALARDIQLALEVVLVPAIRAAKKNLLDIGLRGSRLASDGVAVAGRVPPAQHRETLFADDPLDNAFALQPLMLAYGQKHHADRIGARLGQRKSEAPALAGKKLVRNLNQDACAVASLRIAAGRAAVRQPDEHLDAHLDHLVGLLAAHARDKAHSAVVALVPRVVQTLRWRQAWRYRRVLHCVLLSSTLFGL